MSALYHDPQNLPTKICTKCHIEKPLDQFPKQSKTPDGHRAHCKACASIAFKRYNNAHPRRERNAPLPAPEGVTSKMCTSCHIEKPLDAFSKGKSERFGVRARCKECISEHDRLIRQQNVVPRPLPPTEKICITCGINKSIDDFYKAGNIGRNARSHRRKCKDCVLKEQSSKHFQKRNTERVQLPLIIFSRVCTSCGIEKPVEEFPLNKNFRNGVHSRCKKCVDTEAKQRAARQSKLPLPVSKVCGKCHEEKSLDQFPASSGYGKYGRSSVCKQCYGTWRKENPLITIKASHIRRARKMQAPSEKVDFQYIIKRDGYWCHICNKPIDPQAKGGVALSFDHVKPLAGKGDRKGTHTIDNIKPAHKCCNSRKHTRLLSEMSDYDRRGPDA
jgi:hypothetical protein